MGKPIILENPIIAGVKKLHPYGKSSAITIPKGALTFLNLKNGNRLVISVDIKNEMIVLSKPKNIKDKISDGSYKLSMSKEQFKKLLKE